ncbi:MAG TPA: hypothetical protein VJZ01_11750 [Lachnospiraceae bacterium]|jgi:hypothetical protein|nr:hypothetical protein [Lachnospiraceae bacterium]
MFENGDTYNIEINDGNFDFHAFFDDCEEFCRGKGMAIKEIRAIQLLIEEVVVNHLMKHTEQMNFEITCVGDRHYADIRFEYMGDSYDIFDDEDAKDLSVVLIRCLTDEYTYEFNDAEHKNTMKIIIKFLK